MAGLVRDQVDLLLERHPHERIERPLDWLPQRNAKSPARFLMAAVENDYDPPPGTRLQQVPMQAEGQKTEGQQPDVPPSAPPDRDLNATELEMPQANGPHEE